MKRSTLFLNVATILYLVAWVSPVVAGGTTLAKGGLPGWEALRAALSPIWDRSITTWWLSAVWVLSALTNGWFLYALASLAGRLSASPRLLFAGSAAAVLINAHWLVFSDLRSDLRIGYYLWVASFVALAASARSARAFPVAPGAATGEPTRA
jgi:hypothetical protein